MGKSTSFFTRSINCGVVLENIQVQPLSHSLTHVPFYLQIRGLSFWKQRADFLKHENVFSCFHVSHMLRIITSFCIPLSLLLPSLPSLPPSLFVFLHSFSFNSEAILCDIGEFHCIDRKTCIPEAWLCDGEPDCPDDSDETDQTCKSNHALLFVDQ